MKSLYESFCFSQAARQGAGWGASLPKPSNLFLEALNLPFVHQLCGDGYTGTPPSVDPQPPPMGDPVVDFFELHDGSRLQAILTRVYMIGAPFLSLASLWFLLFSALIAPVGCLLLMQCDSHYRLQQKQERQQQERQPLTCTTCQVLFIEAANTRYSSYPSTRVLTCISVSSVACSLAVMCDTLYRQEFGTHYGAILFLISSLLTGRTCYRLKLFKTGGFILVLWCIAGYFCWDPVEESFSWPGQAFEGFTVKEGLYYSTRNPPVEQVVSHWDPTKQRYGPEYGATRWMVTGDVRTGLPFFLNWVNYDPKWIRVWLPQTTLDGEALALDIAFPETGHDFSRPSYFVLHGLNGGSNEGYVNDLAMRRNSHGSTVVVMVARGMMDTPLQYWNFFHGARVEDAQDAALAVRKALAPHQVMVGVGYSMGAIVLNNYVATYGSECPLDAAFSISGALDCRFEMDDTRSKQLWQPLVAGTLRRNSLLGKWGHRLHARLSKSEIIQLMRATSVVELDKWVAAYHRYDSQTHFYQSMSALDIPQALYHTGQQHDNITNAAPRIVGKISNIAIPLCILHALDDPIGAWKSVAANEGFMRPDILSQSGEGNLLLLLTRTGGHLGWPLGWFSFRRKWEFMNEAAASFSDAVVEAKRADT